MIPVLHLTMATATAAEVTSVESWVAGSVGSGSVSGFVAATPSEVADLVADCAQLASWFPDIVSASITADAGDARCSGQTDVPWPLSDRTWQAHLSRSELGDDVHVVAFHYLPGSGNLARMDGEYRLSPTPGGTRVDYQVEVDLGFWVPGPVSRWATRRVLPEIIHGIGRVLRG